MHKEKKEKSGVITLFSLLLRLFISGVKQSPLWSISIPQKQQQL